MPALILSILVVVVVANSMAYTTYDTGQGLLYRLSVEQDVLLSGTSNYNHLEFLIVGQHPQYPNKRSLIQFESLPAECAQIKWAKMYLYFVYAHKASFHTVQQTPYISRPIQVHQVNVSWDETQANAQYRLFGVRWSKPYLALDGTDADRDYLDTVTLYAARKRGYMEFDITAAVQNWQSGDPNHGLLIWATNELEEGRDIRFASKESSDSTTHAAVHVFCPTQSCVPQ